VAAVDFLVDFHDELAFCFVHWIDQLKAIKKLVSSQKHQQKD
jgi:hypothetical protein